MYPDLCGTLGDEELLTEGLAVDDGARETMDVPDALDTGTPTCEDGAELDGGFADEDETDDELELDDVAEALAELDDEPPEVAPSELESVTAALGELRVAATAADAEESPRDNGYATTTATTAATTAAAPVRTTARLRLGCGADSGSGSAELAMVKESSRPARPAPASGSGSPSPSITTPAVKESCGTARLEPPAAPAAA
jgi:hypothetical protein